MRLVGDIAEQIRGVTYSKDEVRTTASVGFVPILRANNIDDDRLSFEDIVYVPEARISAQQRLKVGDVVIAASSGSLSAVGKAAPLVAEFGGSFGAFCKVLRPNEGLVDPVYFANFFKTRTYRRIISGLATGANINNLKNEHLNNLEILLPSLDEQRRIAAILSKADTLRLKRKRALESLDRLTQSVFLEMFGDVASGTEKFPRQALGDLIRVRSGNGLVAKDMNSNGPYFVYGGNGTNGNHDKFMFKEPKITIGRVGVYCGAVHVTHPESWITDNALYVSETKKPLSMTYLAEALKQANLNQYAGRSAQPLISGSRIYPIEIAYPDAGRQHEFEMFVKKIDVVRIKLNNGAARFNNLFHTLQCLAFRGDL